MAGEKYNIYLFASDLIFYGKVIKNTAQRYKKEGNNKIIKTINNLQTLNRIKK